MGPTTTRLAALALVALLATGCGSDRPAAHRAPAGADPTALPSCPHRGYGTCYGLLRPKVRYTSSSHVPIITFAMPAAGWSNDEDLGGNFLLVPPRNTLDGVDAGTSDFIGVYSSVRPARYTQLPDCTTEPVEGVAGTPAGFADWLTRQPDLTVTPPVATTVGGLSGVRVDLAIKSGATVPECTASDTGEKFRYRPVMVGAAPTEVEHGPLASPPVTMRLYLLAYNHGVLCVELDDVDQAPGTLDSLSAVAEKLEFSG